MGRPRQDYTFDKDKQAFRAVLHELKAPGRRTPRPIIAKLSEIEHKATARGKVARSAAEIDKLLREKRAKALEDYQLKEKEKELEKTRGLRIKNVFQTWLDETKSFRAKDTHRVYSYVVDTYKEIIKDHPLDEYKKEYGKALKDHWDSMNIASRTVFKHLATLQTFFNWCVDNEYLDRPFKIPKPTKETKEPNIYSEKQLDEMLDFFEQRYLNTQRKNHRQAYLVQYRTFFMARETGMRGGEIWSLKLENIDLEKRLIKIKSGKVRVATRQQAGKVLAVVENNWTIKTKSDRSIPMSPRLYEYLRADLANRNPDEIFFLDNGKGVLIYSTEGHLTRAISKGCKENGINEVKPLHGVRASVATHLLYRGVDLVRVQTLLGHSRLETTRLYQNVKNLDFDDTLSKLPESNNAPFLPEKNK